MPRTRPPAFFGYVKIELLSQYRRRWGWKVCKEGGEFVMIASDATFLSAEEAWRAGREVLARLERGETVMALRGATEIA